MATSLKLAVFRSFGLLVLHTLLAVLGPAIVESSLRKFIKIHSSSQVVSRTWIISIVCSFLTAIFMTSALRSRTALWVWMLPAILLGLGTFARSGSYGAGVFGETLTAHFCGSGCAADPDPKECRDFFVFTVPSVRTLAYSVGALLWFVLRLRMSPTPGSLAGTEDPGV